MRRQGIFRVIDRGELGAADDGGHCGDGTADDGEFRAHEHGDGHLYGGKADASHQAHEHHALEAFEAVARDDDHEERAEDRQWCELQGRVGRKLYRVDARDIAERDDWDADGAIGSRDRIRDEADHRCKHRIDADAGEHAGRDRDGRAEASHALEEATESPADQQDQHAAVIADGRQHLLDRVHRLRLKGQVVGEDGRDDDEQDWPAGECNAFERRFDCMGNRHVIDKDAGCQGDDECNRAGLVGCHLEHTQRDDEP